MGIQPVINRDEQSRSTSSSRSKLLASLPVTEHQTDIAGIPSTVLLGGEGPPVILLHGPGESSLWWMRVIPKLVKANCVIVPDLPGHGSSKVDRDKLDVDLVFDWLSELIARTCSSTPALVGHILGGAIAARFSVDHGQQISQLVLVDSLGLGKFRPAPAFAFGLLRFMLWSTEKNYNRFLQHCLHDMEDLSKKMGSYWEPFLAYNLECAHDSDRRAAMQTLMKIIGVPKIPSENLGKINVPVALIWGRHDKANKLKIAEAASQKYGWPLHIIEETRDDPKLERPEAFVQVLNTVLQRANP